MGAVWSAKELAAARATLLSTGYGALDSPVLRRAWLELHESWLIAKAAEIEVAVCGGFAIVAIGGMGRQELMPFSDLDLILLHDSMPADRVERVADLLWYPLWDANIRLDHSVRTVAETLRVADTDMTAGLAMLEARHIAGAEALSTALIGGVRRQWRSGIRSRMGELVEMTHARWQRRGRIAHRAEPDLKSGCGGLRDVHLLNALAVAQLVDRHGVADPELSVGSLDGAYQTLLDVRTELHRVSGRARDLLQAQYADEIGATLGFGDRFDLARVVSDAGRTISYHAEAGLRTAANALPRRGMSAWRRRPKRRPLGEGVVEFAGEVVLARDVRSDDDPGLILRVAAASAVTGLPISAATLSCLVDTAPEMPDPWPRQAFDDLLVLLSAGPTAVSTIEALDRTGLWGRLLPEWRAIRDLPPRDIAHTWTVDRHLVEAVVQAAALTTRVARPDLLVLGALLHDIGKGRGADHSVIGAELAAGIGTRLGMPPAEVEMLAKLVRYHLLLPMLATRRDLNDPQTVTAVSEALGGDPVLLDVLHALAEADALATGPGVWGTWKASLVGELVRRCATVPSGASLPSVDATWPDHLAVPAGLTAGPLAETGVQVEITPADSAHLYHVVMNVPDDRGVLSNAAGVLALNALRVHSAAAHTRTGAGVIEFVVSPHFGSPVAAELLRQQLISALAGDLDVLAALHERDNDAAKVAAERAGEVLTGVPFVGSIAPPRILWFETGTTGQLIVEVRAADRPGLLARLSRALERAGVDIGWAKVNTFGSTVDDVFCVRLPAESSLSAGGRDGGLRAGVERQLLAVLTAADASAG